MRSRISPTAVAVLAAATTMRPGLVALGPLAPRLATDLGTGFAQVGLITTIAIACVAMASPFGPHVGHRIGVRSAVAWLMAGLGIIGILRAIAPGIELIVLLSAAIGGCIGLVQSLPAVEVRAARLAPRIGSAAFTSGLVGSSIVATLLVVPLADLFGGWRASLVLLSLPALAAVAVWLVATPRRSSEDIGRAALPWRDRTAWLLAVAFGLQAAVYQCLMAWLPAILVEDGWTEAWAGACVALVNVLALASNLVLLFGGSRIAQGAGAIVVVAVFVLVAVLLLAIGAPAIVGALMAGASLGAILPLLVGLAMSHAGDPAQAGAVSAFMYLVGFSLAAVGPVALGAVRDRTGGFEAALWLLAAIAFALLLVTSRMWYTGRWRSEGARVTA